jgi:hypothetical protein
MFNSVIACNISMFNTVIRLRLPPDFTLVSCSAYFPTLRKETTRSFETLVGFNGLHGVTFQTIELFITTAVRTSYSCNLIIYCLYCPTEPSVFCVPSVTAKQPFRTMIYHFINTLKTSFNTTKLCILPTQCICVFRMVLTINSDCFPKQH